MYRKSNNVEDKTRRSTKKERETKNKQKYGVYTSQHVRICSHKKGEIVYQRHIDGDKFNVEQGSCGRMFITGKK